jgi:DNA-binding NarL/FixJ family response regulator
VVDAGGGSVVAAASVLAVIDRHLPDVARDRDRQLSARGGETEEGARLVAAGKASRQIAAELYLSEKTVETRLYHVFTKLGFRRAPRSRGFWLTSCGRDVASGTTSRVIAGPRCRRSWTPVYGVITTRPNARPVST